MSAELPLAAQVWLGHIPAPDQLVAVIGTRAELTNWAARLAIVLLGCALIGRSGALPRIEQALRDRGAREQTARLASCTVFVAIMLGGALLPQLGSPMLFLVAALAPVMVMVLARWRRWWMLGAPAAAALVIAWAMAPSLLAGDGPPAPPGPARTAIQQMLAQAGLKTARITLSPVAGFDADVSGTTGPVVSFSREALRVPLPELKAYVAHILAHYLHHDVLIAALLLGAGAFAAMLAVAFGARATARLVAPGARLQDPAGLPATAAILALALAITTPVLGAVMRQANVRADQYALDLAREPDGLAAVLIRTWDYRALRPEPLQEAILYTHPPLAERIAHAMRWKDKAAQTR